MSDNQIEKKSRKKITDRCPNGTRKNKKTKECEPIIPLADAPLAVAPLAVASASVASASPAVEERMNEGKKSRKKITERCPNGTRKNKKTKECEPLVPVVDDPPPTSLPPTSVPPAPAPPTVDATSGQLERIAKQLASLIQPKPELILESAETESAPESASEPDEIPITESCDYDLEKDLNVLDCNNTNMYSDEACNKFMLKKEQVERNCINDQPDANLSLYPNMNDTNFNIKIATKQEFNDTKYDGEIYEDIEEHANELAKADFELQPHQAFVKNFLSFQTPYNSLLLYHGLGTGKTCSAIGVCEEMRLYSKQVGFSKKILIVASENVQDNFRSQLFDERKMKQHDGIWTIGGCIGNSLLKEVNPMSMRGVSREKIISQINGLINANYMFLGYEQFANYIMKKMKYAEEMKLVGERGKFVLNQRVIQRLRQEFDNRLIVIDEVHNIRKTDEKNVKKGSDYLEWLVKSAENMRFLLLSATPMYNSYKEIIWLLNLMNMNDRRGKIKVGDVFDGAGNFKPNGEELLVRKATGYISVVRGENPYTFPYRVYPDIFAEDHTFPAVKYPSYQMNLKKIKEEDHILRPYLLTIGKCGGCGECQYCAYRYITHKLRDKMPSFSAMETFGYKVLQTPIEALIISYPHNELKLMIDQIEPEKYVEVVDDTNESVDIETEDQEFEEQQGDEGEDGEEQAIAPVVGGANEEQYDYGINPKELTGKLGMERMMNFIDSRETMVKGNYEYKETTLAQYGKIFSKEKIGKYSAKIKFVLDMIANAEKVSNGIILVYSQYIDSGLIPMALALEEMGFQRYGDGKQLFKEKPSTEIDARTMQPQNVSMPACYAMITGDRRLSPNNENEVKGLTNENNKDGHKIKVVLISRAGSEGIDLKFIRQVHILDPWYNMNRLEQIIGRAVRNQSHKDLRFDQRNVQIFMHGTILDNNMEESADLYMYRVAEFKAKQIGRVSRVLKESAVDCILNHGQTNFSQEIMDAIVKNPVRQILSDGYVIADFKVGDAPNSASCDYMDTCYYECKPTKDIKELNRDTYDESYIKINFEKIMQRIRMLFKEGFFYKKKILINSVNLPKEYPLIQIYAALTQLIDDPSEFITDKYGRAGHLVNNGDYYLFQPVEISDPNASVFDRSVPVDYKNRVIDIEINPKIAKPKAVAAIIHADEGLKTIDIFKKNYEIVNEFIGKPTIKQTGSAEEDGGSNDDWYKHCGVVMTKLEKEYPESVQKENPKTVQYKGFAHFKPRLIVAHMIELLMFVDKLELLNYIFSLKTIVADSMEMWIKDYFTDMMIVTDEYKALVLYELNIERIMLLTNGKWTDAVPYDKEQVKQAPQLGEMNKDEYNKIIGFIGYEKNYRYLVFKTKDMTLPRHTGTRCDEAGFKTSEYLNEMIGNGKNEYNKESNKLKKDKQGNIIQYKRTHEELCVTHELMMRYYHADNINGEKWFLTPEMALYYELYKIFVKS